MMMYYMYVCVLDKKPNSVLDGYWDVSDLSSHICNALCTSCSRFCASRFGNIQYMLSNNRDSPVHNEFPGYMPPCPPMFDSFQISNPELRDIINKK